MTYSSRELAAKGVGAFALEWRKWRRSMRLTIPEAAACAGVRAHYLQQIELARFAPGPVTRAKLVALMERWDGSRRPKRGPERRGAHLRRRTE